MEKENGSPPAFIYTHMYFGFQLFILKRVTDMRKFGMILECCAQ
jgi:hypothetical protein